MNRCPPSTEFCGQFSIGKRQHLSFDLNSSFDICQLRELVFNFSEPLFPDL